MACCGQGDHPERPASGGNNGPVSDHVYLSKPAALSCYGGSECVPISHESSDWGGKMQHHSIEPWSVL